MKLLKFFLLFILASGFILPGCSQAPEHKNVWVSDNEHVLSQQQLTSLDSLYKAHEKITGNEIGLVTTADYGTDTSIMMFAVNFGRKAGIGKKERDNGVIIVFSQAKREVNIATGYGTEKVLTDEIAKKIIDSVMTPRFREAKIFEGLWNGSKAIVSFLELPGNSIK